jgi:peptidoglycan-N-acetylglucosamine deacetylase
VLKLPFHMSYLLYLARISERMMHTYLGTAIALCRAARLAPSFLLHPLDLLGRDQVPQLAFFPGMDVPGARKQRLLVHVLEVLARYYRLVPMGVHAQALTAGSTLRSLEPHLAVQGEPVQ